MTRAEAEQALLELAAGLRGPDAPALLLERLAAVDPQRAEVLRGLLVELGAAGVLRLRPEVRA